MARGREHRARRKPDSSRVTAEAGETGEPIRAPRAPRVRGERRPGSKSEKKRARGRGEDSIREAAPWRRAGGGSGRGPRGLARLFYWAVVLTLWGFIAAIAAIAWGDAHLPASQSLQVPQLPPAIEIVDLSGRMLAA